MIHRSSKPLRGADRVPGGFDSHTLPCRTALFAAFVLLTHVPSLSAQEIPAASPDSTAAEVSPVIQEEAPGKSPMGAFFRSVLVPGWGQFYADQPVRGFVYLGLQSATAFMIIRTSKRIDDAESEELKDARREQLEDWLVLGGFIALVSGIDAWVSAHMWGFEGEVVPPPDGSPGAALQISVPVGGF